MLMDDPISALDANVKKKIFKKVFMKKFRGKTRILVTHAVDFLQFVDTIVLFKEGRIVLKGSYTDLKESDYLKEVIGIYKSHMNLGSKDEEVKIDNEKKGGFAINEADDKKDEEEDLDGIMESLSDVESNSSQSSISEDEN